MRSEQEKKEAEEIKKKNEHKEYDLRDTMERIGYLPYHEPDC